MAQEYTRAVLKVSVAQICSTIGWHAMHTSSGEVMVDILHRCLLHITKQIHRCSEHVGRTEATLDDVALAFQEMGISVSELEEYIQFVESVPFPHPIPQYPMQRESRLNFLKPGSREVVHRPVHVHEHLPPMHPEMEDDEYNTKMTSGSTDSIPASGATSPLSSPKGSVFKRPGEPGSVENLALKRARLLIEEEGRPLREISSVMMTTSGFLSPAREGKLPESRPTLQPSDSRSSSPQPPTYPTVPPEVKGEKKVKKMPVKKMIGIKRIDKENKKKDLKVKDSIKLEKEDREDDSKVKKLVAMKEISKLKALKQGAVKLSPQSSQQSPPKNKSPKLSGSPKIGSLKLSAIKIPKINKTLGIMKNSRPDKNRHKLVNPLVNPLHLKLTPVQESSKEQSIEKISSEPDKQKLNILKKLSKVKDEKIDKTDKIDQLEFVQKDSRESSPGLVIDEVEIQNRQKEARLAQINDTIDAVIQHGIQEFDKEVKDLRTSIVVAEVSSKVDNTISEVISMHSPDSSKDVYSFDDNDLSPPGTPSTPKTPELPTPSQKLEKVQEKKRSKDKVEKNKVKKEVKTKVPKDISSPKKLKLEVTEPDTPERPKTPEVREPHEDMHIPVFPFFPSFPPSPGLIPPPLQNPLFPRFSLPPYSKLGTMLGQSPFLGMNAPHPAMPNLPLPPPLFMQPKTEVFNPPSSDPPEVKEAKEPEKQRSPPPPLSQVPLKQQSPSPELVKEKVVIEKKSKEHKKEKREKLKKKKEKREKDKAKDKLEKKKDKEERKERVKADKKEKKKERKEKEREERSEPSVPKITFKFGGGPSSPRPPTPEPQPRKIVIKPIPARKPKENESVDLVGSDRSVGNGQPACRSPSPELARFSALVTRPPKTKSTPKLEPVVMVEPLQQVAVQPPVMGPAPISREQPSPQTLLPPQTPPPPSLAILPVPSQLPSGSTPKPIKAVKPVKVPPKEVFKKTDQPQTTVAYYFDPAGNKIWICPACGGQDDGSAMIGCDDCDAWYHWVCVGIQVPPDDNEDWYCRSCIVKKQSSLSADRKKKGRKKK